MSHEVHYHTPASFEKSKQELQRLKTVERARISEEMREARDKGDLSENAEFDAAKEAQENLEKQIANLQLELANARIIHQDQLNTSRVSILSKVKLKNTSNDMVVHYTLVPQSEANFKEAKISVTSPIGKGLLGKKVGEQASIIVPAGKLTFEVLEISF